MIFFIFCFLNKIVLFVISSILGSPTVASMYPCSRYLSFMLARSSLILFCLKTSFPVIQAKNPCFLFCFIAPLTTLFSNFVFPSNSTSPTLTFGPSLISNKTSNSFFPSLFTLTLTLPEVRPFSRSKSSIVFWILFILNSL
ncbi:hypothetical protein ES703_117693 [subsurface metagenome]